MANKKIKIKAKNEDLKGFYSNLMNVSNTREEFFLDFFTVTGKSGALSSRVIVSPDHLKRIIKVLQNSMDKYEKKFGDVEESKESDKKIGFVTE